MRNIYKGALFLLVFAFVSGLLTGGQGLPGVTAAATGANSFSVSNLTVKNIYSDNFDVITFSAPEDYGLTKDNITVTDNTRTGICPMLIEVTYNSGTYTVIVNDLCYQDTYTLTIAKTGYTTYTSGSLYYGTIAANADIDLIYELNIFDTYSRSYDESTGVVTISNSTYAANAVLYPDTDANSLFKKINTNNGFDINSADTYRVIGSFVVAPAGAKGAKSYDASTKQMVKVGTDSLIDSNPNYQESVASGEAANDNDYWKTIYAYPVYMKNAVKLADGSWVLYDAADRTRIVEWYDNADCTGTPIRVVRLTTKLEYTGTSVSTAPAGYPSITPMSSSKSLDVAASGLITDAVISGFSGWNGGTLTVNRVSLAFADDLSSNDEFIFLTNDDFSSDASGNLSDGTNVFASSVTTAGKLTITFNSNATDSLVQTVARNVGYSNTTPYGDARIKLTLSDGTKSANSFILVTSSTIFVDYTTYDTNQDANDGFNLAEALLKAEDGDTILIKDGTYQGQFLVSTAVTINAAKGADGSVIIKSPATADLKKSEQDCLTANGLWRMPILELQTAVPNLGTVTVKNITVDGDFQAVSTTDSKHMLGIAVFNTNAVIDGVVIKRIAAQPNGSTGKYEGYSVNFGILAEGAGNLSSPVNVTIQNSTIGTYQKTGIVAWGPKLNVNIKDNFITGVGGNDSCGQNGIQIGSKELRKSTTATISGNTISNLSFDNSTYFASGIILRQAGTVEVVDNTISGNGTVFEEGKGVTCGIDLMEMLTPASIHGNTMTAMQYGICVEAYGPEYYSGHQFANNNLASTYYAFYDMTDNGVVGYDEANNENISLNSDTVVNNDLGYLLYMLYGGNDTFADIGAAPSKIDAGAGNDNIKTGSGADIIIGGAGDDTLSGGSGNDVFSYGATGNGADTIMDFSTGDIIRVSGCSFAKITSGDGASVAANSIEASISGEYTILYIDTDATEDAAELQIRLYGSYQTLYFTLNGTDISYSYVPYYSSTSQAKSAVVVVNGQARDAGTSQTITTGGQTTTTITVDATKLDKLLETSGAAPTVTLPSTGSAVTIGELNGQTVKNMEKKEAVLEIKTDTVSYTLPASEININDVSSQLGSQVALKDIKVSISIAEPSADTARIVEDTAKKGGYQLVVKPVEFEITCTSGGRTVDVSKFNGYVARTVAIPDDVDPSKITTGIVLNADGTFTHVPTQVVAIGGKYFAKINSLTNSTYSVIYNPVEFTDVANHWAKAAINDMGSRMVVTGMGNNTYGPERSITRAEFAAVAVRALGLKKGTTESVFGDVTLTDWFNGYVETATAYSLITGYDSTSYGPNDTITREQAMAILARAMKLTGLSVSLTDSEVSELLAKYTDGASVSNYAKASVAACLKAGIVSGSSATTLSPKAYVTRVEVAVMVQRMLQKSELI